jgi:type IV pilus assembly protein PilN
MTPRINLLPHREMKKAAKRRDFAIGAGLVAALAVMIVILVGGVIQGYISAQTARNQFIKGENEKLDGQIKEIANLREEIEALKARQTAVENLQGDRNQPVQLLDELVTLVPEGVFLRTLKQNGPKVTLTGLAQSNERVSEFLRNLGASKYLESPELVEIKASTFQAGKDQKKAFDFNLNVQIKRKRDDEAKKGGIAAAKPAEPTK